MVYLQMHQKIEDYSRWRPVFEGMESTRLASGATGEKLVLRNVDDPHEVTLVLTWSDVEKARAFTQSAALRDALQRAGVMGAPQIRILESAD